MSYGKGFRLMRQLLTGAVLIFLFVCAGSSSAAEAEGDAVLESISYEKDDDNAEKIIFKLNGAHIPKVFKIKGERPRLVFDFLDTRYSDLINRITDTQGNLIQGVRVGIHNDPPKTRVVIDLKPEGDIAFEQDFLERENTLSITFHPTEADSGAAPAAADLPEKSADRPAPPPAAVSESPGAPEPETGQPFVRPDPPVMASSGEAKTEAKIKAEPVKPVVETAAVTPTAPAVEQPSAAKPAADQSADMAAPAVPSGSTSAGDIPVAPATPEISASVIPTAPADPVLRDVSFETTADNSEMVLFKLNDFYPPIVFGIEKGNPRVVCDFLDTAMDKSIRPVIKTKGNYISGIRVARHGSPDKVRVVLDLVPNRNYDLQQVFFKEDNLFIIIINEFEEEPIPSATLNTELSPGAAPES